MRKEGNNTVFQLSEQQQRMITQLKQFKDQVLKLRQKYPFLKEIFGCSGYCFNLYRHLIEEVNKANNNLLPSPYKISIFGEEGTGRQLIKRVLEKATENKVEIEIKDVSYDDDLMRAQMIEKPQYIYTQKLFYRSDDPFANMPDLIPILQTWLINKNILNIVPEAFAGILYYLKIVIGYFKIWPLKTEGTFGEDKRFREWHNKETVYSRSNYFYQKYKPGMDGIHSAFLDLVPFKDKNQFDFADIPENLRSHIQKDVDFELLKTIYEELKFSPEELGAEQLSEQYIKETDFIHEVFCPFFYGIYEVKDQKGIAQLMDKLHKQVIIDYQNQRNSFSIHCRTYYEYLFQCLIYWEVLNSGKPDFASRMIDNFYFFDSSNFDDIFPQLKNCIPQPLLKDEATLKKEVIFLYDSLGAKNNHKNFKHGYLNYIPDIWEYAKSKNIQISIPANGAIYKFLKAEDEITDKVLIKCKTGISSYSRNQIFDLPITIEIQPSYNYHNYSNDNWKTWFCIGGLLTNYLQYEKSSVLPHHILIASFFIPKKDIYDGKGYKEIPPILSKIWGVRQKAGTDKALFELFRSLQKNDKNFPVKKILKEWHFSKKQMEQYFLDNSDLKLRFEQHFIKNKSE